VEAWISRHVKLYYITTCLSLNGPKVTPRDITRPNRDTRDIWDTRERTPSRKTPMDGYGKFKARIIKN